MGKKEKKGKRRKKERKRKKKKRKRDVSRAGSIIRIRILLFRAEDQLIGVLTNGAVVYYNAADGR
jgi:hypothetical protein